MRLIGKILCPIDFSESSEAAVRYASQLARQLNASVELVHVYQLPVYALPDGAIMAAPEFAVNLSSRLQEQLDQVLAAHRAEGLVTGGHLVEGRAEAEIVATAKQLGADIIVMGTHGRTGISHMILGSVAERVVRMSDVPVLTIRSAP